MLVRDPKTASTESYDLIIVGGGIYGAMLALEATGRGLRPLLVERDDFGGATSFNSLRIVHGGLRYLQSFDFPRILESTRERSWFLRSFPDLVAPLPCLMPLYDDFPKTRPVMSIALALNDVLTWWYNRELSQAQRVPRGALLDREQTVANFPNVFSQKLCGAAVWCDAAMPDSQRVLMETLRWAVARGAVVLNYVEATALLKVRGKVTGIRARDSEGKSDHEYRSAVVINTAGPWSRCVAALLDRDFPALIRPSLAWNLLFDRTAPSRYALALTPPKPRAPTYFMHPWKGRLLLGTGHAAWSGDLNEAKPSDAHIEGMLTDINAAAPTLELRRDEIARVFSGLLPARSGNPPVRLTARPMIVDHTRNGGPRALISVCGVKLTTARNVARTVLSMAAERRYLSLRHSAGFYGDRPSPLTGWRIPSASGPKERILADLRRVIESESVVHLDDLVFRRTTLWENPKLARTLAPDICRSAGWSGSRTQFELRRLRELIDRSTQEQDVAPSVA